jgi:glycine cleavage system H protein
MDFPKGLLYTKTHEWVRAEGGSVTIGITEFAAEELGDVVYVELPEPGRTLRPEEVFGTVESVKAVSDLVSPVAGEVVEANPELAGSPEQVNVDPYGKGWMVKVKLPDAQALSELMDSDAYTAFVAKEGSGS